MPSEAFTNIETMLRGMMPDPDIDTDALRAGYDLLGSMFPPAEAVTVSDGETAGVTGQWHDPAEHDDRTILYLHGGGYVIGSSSSHRSLVSHLATAARARAFVPDYRLAPEHPFPAAIDDACAVYRGLLDSGVDPARLIVAGDSAGGGLTVATLIRLRDEDTVLPAAAVVISPWADLTQSGDSMRTFGDQDLIVKPAMLDRWATLYLGDAPAGAPWSSPLFGDLAGLPPLLIHVGDQESLLDDARRLDVNAREAGVDAELAVAADMIHVWHMFAGSVPESDEAVAAIGAWVIDHVA